MPIIAHTTFDGMVPRLEPGLLPENAAQEARNLDLRRGVLTPIRGRVADTRTGADAAAPLIEMLGGAVSETDAAAWAAIVAPRLAYIVNYGRAGQEYVEVEPDFSGAADMDDVADAITDAMAEAEREGDSAAWDGEALRFVLRFAADAVMIDEAEDDDLAAAAWLNMAGAEGMARQTIHLWRYRTGGIVGGGVEFGEITNDDWDTWRDLGYESGFSIVLNGRTYQIRPDFSTLETEGDPAPGKKIVLPDIQHRLTRALQIATGNPSITLSFLHPLSDEDPIRVTLNTGGMRLSALGPPANPALTDISGEGWLEATSLETETLPEVANEKWLVWNKPVSVVRSPVNDDFYGRIYYTGDGAPKMRLVRDGEELERALAVETPIAALTAVGTPLSDPDPEADERPPEGAFAVRRCGMALVQDGKVKAETYLTATLRRGVMLDTFTIEEQTVVLGGFKRTGEVEAFPVVGINMSTVGSVYGNNPLVAYGWQALVYGLTSLVVKVEPVAGKPRDRKVTVRGMIRVQYSRVDETSEEGEPTDPIEDAAYPSYCYSYVTDIGEEGPLSPATAPIGVVASETVTLSDIAQPADAEARGIEKIRVYRSASGQFRWLMDLDVGTTTAYDPLPGDDSTLGEAAPEFADPPPDDLQGIVATANGWFAGFRDREVCFSEPFQATIWPAAYRLTMQHEVVALAPIGTDVLVLTTGRPVLLSGTDPETLAAATLEADQSCVSAAGVALLGHTVLYPSPDGLTAVYAGQAQVLTRGLYRREDWQALRPERITAAAHDGQYVAAIGNELLVFDIGVDAADRVTMADGSILALLSDTVDDALYVSEGGAICAWRASGAAVVPFTWQGRLWKFPQPTTFAVLRVRAASYPVPGEDEDDFRPMVRLYADGVLAASVTVTSAAAVKLPLMRPARSWEIAVLAGVEVHSVEVASSMGLLAR